MLQQVAEGVNAQFFLEQVAFLRADTFQEFNGRGKYICFGGYCFLCKNRGQTESNRYLVRVVYPDWHDFVLIIPDFKGPAHIKGLASR